MVENSTNSKTRISIEVYYKLLIVFKANIFNSNLIFQLR